MEMLESRASFGDMCSKMSEHKSVVEESTEAYRKLAKEFNDLNFKAIDLRRQLDESREAHMESAEHCSDLIAENRRLQNELKTLEWVNRLDSN